MYTLYILYFQRTAEAVASATNAMVQRYTEILREKVFRTLRQNHIDPATVQDLESQFEIELPFEKLTTAYERNKYIKDNFMYIVST